MTTLLLWLLILIPIATAGLVATTVALRKRWIIRQLLNEGEIDQALKLIRSYKKKEELAKRLLLEGQISQGLHVFQRIGNHKYIQEYIYHSLPIPRKFYYVEEGWWILKEKKQRRSPTADLLYNAATKLLILKQHVDLMNNQYIPNSLKNDIRIGLDDGFYILWDICHRLSLIEIQQLPIEERNLKAACDDVQKLIHISNQAEAELGQLTLERDATRMNLYQDTFRRFTEEAREIRNAKRLLSSCKEETSNKPSEGNESTKPTDNSRNPPPAQP